MSREASEGRPAVAVIGMAGRFPGAKDLQAYWQNLREGVESLTALSDEELLAAGVEPELLLKPNYVKRCTHLEGAELFDATFFGLNAREAEVLDPQHRLFLECAWEALEDAGYVGEACQDSIGVYAGASMNTYVFANLLANRTVLESVGPYQIMLGSDKDFLATRVSYKLNLRGPSLSVQTACSTSLVAVQIAWQSLLDYQCDLALAGGVSITFPQRVGYVYSEGMIFSPDGHCRPFDAQAKGIRGGSGAGVVVLKRLSEALADGDNIRAVIRGAAINNDGAGKMGYTAPSVDGQAEVVAMALARAGFDPDTISYVEAHGTATPIGDPIEVAALTKAFRTQARLNQFCAVGSVKGNIGHLDAAAGVAGLIKTVLALEHRELPPSLHYHQPNPQIDFENSPFFVNSQLRAWRSEAGPRRAGVSSFGIGGTNAHVVLEEAPVRPESVVAWPAQLLVLSAKTPAALEAATDNLAAHLVGHPEIGLADICFTLQVGRKCFDHRRAVVCRGSQDAAAALSRRDPKRVTTSDGRSGGRAVAFLFSGQGSQYPGMGRSLYESQATFRSHFDRCADFLRPHLGLDVRDLVFRTAAGVAEGGRAGDDASASRLNETRYAQPALFALEYALARMWMQWGVEPAAMIGHSIGEYVAAAVAEVFSLEDATMLVAERGRLMQELPAGRMLAVPLTPDELAGLPDARVAVAAVNAPSLCTVSGPSESIAALERSLSSRGIDCRPLHTSHAFHSAMMDPILDGFAEVVRRVPLGAPRRPYVSNLTGTWITTAEATSPEYWVKHLRGTVRFADGLREITKMPAQLLLEVGPGNTLTTFARQAAHKGALTVSSLPHARDGQPDVDVVLNSLGRLWMAGVEPDWERFHEGEKLRRVPLPTHPFERQRYWVEPQRPEADRQPDAEVLRKNPRMSEWFYVPSWKRSVVPRALEEVAAHEEGTSWLVFLDECGIGARVVERLRAEGQHCIAIRPGSEFRLEADFCTVDPSAREHYDRLVQGLRRPELASVRVLHLWNVTGGPVRRSMEDSLNLAFFSLFSLAQAIGEAQLTAPVRLVAVSNGLQWVTGTESIQPEKATLLGPCRVVPEEYQNISCCAVDIDAATDGDGVGDDLVRQLIHESRADGGGPAVAYRSGQRWEQIFEPLKLEQNAASGMRLRERGVYLITGGLGGIGLTIARHLAQEARARLVLISRSPLPPREEWQTWLSAHPGQDPSSARIRALQEIEAAGGEVVALQADVADRGEMEAAFDEALRRFGTIHGVVHAAGVAGGGLIQFRAREAAERVLAPKVGGTLVLASLLKRTEPDFFVLCSSIDALCPVAGAADYCAANAFLDAYAASCRSPHGATVVSINWDPWSDVGMAVNAKVPAALEPLKVSRLRTAMSPNEGVEALRRALSAGLPQVAVIPRDLRRMLERRREGALADVGKSDLTPERSAADQERALSAASNHVRPGLSTLFSPPETDSQRRIAGIWQEVLGIDGIGIDDNFFELGGHSLLATGLLARLHEQMGVKLPLRIIFEAPTIRELAECVQTVQSVAVGAPLQPADAEIREEFEL